jgi:hypothetical protein
MGHWSDVIWVGIVCAFIRALSSSFPTKLHISPCRWPATIWPGDMTHTGSKEKMDKNDWKKAFRNKLCSYIPQNDAGSFALIFIFKLNL